MLEGHGWWYFTSCSNKIVWLISRSAVINTGMIKSNLRTLSLYSINGVFKNLVGRLMSAHTCHWSSASSSLCVAVMWVSRWAFVVLAIVVLIHLKKQQQVDYFHFCFLNWDHCDLVISPLHHQSPIIPQAFYMTDQCGKYPFYYSRGNPLRAIDWTVHSSSCW